MRPPPANTWDIVALLVIHVIIATLVGIGIVTMVVVVIVTETATLLAETEIGAIVEAPLPRVVVDTLPTIGVAGVIPAAHPLEEVVLHLVAEGVQEIMTHQPPQQGLLLLQHPLQNIGGEEIVTPP